MHFSFLQTIKEAFLFNKVFVHSLFHNFSFFDDKDDLRVLYRWDSVCNCKSSPSLHNSVKRFLHNFFVFRVECRSGLIQEQNLRVFGNCSGNGYSLLLSAWDLGSFKSHHSIKTFAQDCGTRIVLLLDFFKLILLDEMESIGLVSEWSDFLKSHVLIVVLDIFLYAAVKYDWLLLHYSEIAAQGLELVFFNIHSV